jgi:hypothetical protein
VPLLLFVPSGTEARPLRGFRSWHYRTGGRAPYGYRREKHDLPEGHRGDTSKHRVTLVPQPDEAAVIPEIFHLHTDRGLGPKAIAERLNAKHLPPPSHVDRARNARAHWSAGTIRAIVRNPVYTGRAVWNRLDFASARQNGGAPRLRAKEEWVVTEDAHLPLISDELFAKAQERFEQRSSRQSNGRAKRDYLFAGMV